MLDWRWQTAVATAALASVVAIVAIVQAPWRLPGLTPVQVAMVTFPDRNVLFEPGDIRMRGAPGQPRAPETQGARYIDIEVPLVAIKDLAAAASTRSTIRRDIIDRYLPALVSGATIVVDSALASRISATQSPSDIRVRVYNLDDARAAEIASAVPGSGPRVLLTVRP